MNPFVSMCVLAIQSGRMTIEQVPPMYRADVLAALAPSTPSPDPDPGVPGDG